MRGGVGAEALDLLGEGGEQFVAEGVQYLRVVHREEADALHRVINEQFVGHRAPSEQHGGAEAVRAAHIFVRDAKPRMEGVMPEGRSLEVRNRRIPRP